MLIRKMIIAFLCFCAGLTAQSVQQLDLEKSLELAMARSYDMRRLRENLAQAEFRMRAATNRFKTHIDLNTYLPDYTETIKRFEDSLGVYYTPIKQGIFLSSLTVRQPLPTDGNFYLQSGIHTLQDYYRENSTTQLNTRLGFEQPLEAIWSYNDIKSSLREARLNYNLQEKRLERTRLDLKYHVSSAFYYLLSRRERQRIARQNLAQQRQAYELAQNKYKAGVIAEVEALQMEVDLGQAINDYDMAVAAAKARADQFKQLLGIPLEDSIRIESDLSYDVIRVDVAEAVQKGLENRLEIEEQRISKELAELEIKRTKVNGQITGKVSAYYDFIGVGADELGVAYTTNVGHAWEELQERPGNRGVSLQLSVPVWDWGVNKARVEAARAELRKTEYALENERVNVKRDIRETVNQLHSSLKRLQLLEKNVKVAEKSFTISQKRFANGDIDSQTLALNRERLNNTRLTHLDAFISYKLMIADLSRKTFYDYEKDLAL